MTGLLINIVLTLIVGALSDFGTVHSRQYRVVVTDPHATFARWALDATGHHSSQSHAEELVARGYLGQRRLREAAPPA